MGSSPISCIKSLDDIGAFFCIWYLYCSLAFKGGICYNICKEQECSIEVFLRRETGAGTMNCKEVQRLLVPYINGGLEEKEEEEFVKHVRHCPECYEELEVYATVFAGIRQLDGAEEEIDYRTLVEDSLTHSEEDVRDERFLDTYMFVLRTAATVVLVYMMMRWFF